MMPGPALSPPSALLTTDAKGLTLVHFSAQRKRFLWDSVCMWGFFRGCSRGSWRLTGRLRCILCQKRLGLS